jgi:hypothetical protein
MFGRWFHRIWAISGWIVLLVGIAIHTQGSGKRWQFGRYWVPRPPRANQKQWTVHYRHPRR